MKRDRDAPGFGPGAARGGGRGGPASGAEPLDWSGLMRLGLGRLRLPPDVFWSMTPRELCAALEGAGLLVRAVDVMDRSRLEALMALHPDGRDP